MLEHRFLLVWKFGHGLLQGRDVFLDGGNFLDVKGLSFGQLLDDGLLDLDDFTLRSGDVIRLLNDVDGSVDSMNLVIHLLENFVELLNSLHNFLLSFSLEFTHDLGEFLEHLHDLGLSLHKVGLSLDKLSDNGLLDFVELSWLDLTFSNLEFVVLGSFDNTFGDLNLLFSDDGLSFGLLGFVLDLLVLSQGDSSFFLGDGDALHDSKGSVVDFLAPDDQPFGVFYSETVLDGSFEIQLRLLELLLGDLDCDTGPDTGYIRVGRSTLHLGYDFCSDSSRGCDLSIGSLESFDA